MFWEIDGVSKSEKAVIELLSGDTYAHPMGVVVFGADSGLKTKAYKRLRGKIAGKQVLGIDHSGIDGYVGQVGAAFRRGDSVIVCFPGEDSVHSGSVFHLERRLTQLGAKSVVAVYAAAVKGDSPDYAYLDRSGLSYAKYIRQLEKLAADPPTYGGVDGFITVRQHRLDAS